MPRPHLSIGDLLLGVALVLFIGVTGLIARAALVNDSGRAKCASNLHQIGLAILLYQNDNNQSLPRTIADSSDKVKPTWGTPYTKDTKLESLPLKDCSPFDGKGKVAANDVTGAFFLLLREEKLTTRVFVCPSAGLGGWNFGGKENTAANWTNWPGPRAAGRHLSYSYQNPYPTDAALAAGYSTKNPDADFAVAGDLNPGGDAVTKVTPASGDDEMKAANSPNHGRDGQNVLYGDGHAEWKTTPFCGENGDNIYTAAGPECDNPGRKTAVVWGPPVAANDSILLPTATETGYKNLITAAETDPPLTAAEHDALIAKLSGKYHEAGNDDAAITIDEDSITSLADAEPVTIRYEVVGGTGDAAVCQFTGEKIEGRGVIYLDHGKLEFALPAPDKAFDREWVKNDAGK